MIPNTPATRTLDLLAIPYRLFEHLRPPTSLEEAAYQRGQDPEQVIRSILFRYRQDHFVMVLIAGPGQVSWKHIRAYLGESRISLATESEVRTMTGCEIGTVNPLGLSASIRILADEHVFFHNEISIGSGARGIAILINSADLRRALGSIEIDLFVNGS